MLLKLPLMLPRRIELKDFEKGVIASCRRCGSLLTRLYMPSLIDELKSGVFRIRLILSSLGLLYTVTIFSKRVGGSFDDVKKPSWVEARSFNMNGALEFIGGVSVGIGWSKSEDEGLD